MPNPNRFSFINPNKSPIYYGYVVLIIGTIGVFASIPGQTVGVSVFTDPLKDALGLTRNQFSNAYMIGTLLSSFFVSRSGVLFDRFGARYVAFFATLLLAFAVLLCSVSVQISTVIKELLNTTSWFIPFGVITLLFFGMRFSGQGVLTMASRNMIMMWFDKNRGKVNAISGISVSLGFSASPILINALIENNGWQLSWQILASSLLIFSFFILQFYRNKPEDFQLKVDGGNNEDVSVEKDAAELNFTLNQAKKTRAFWMYCLTLSFNSFFITGFTFHVISIFTSNDYSKEQAIAVFLPLSIISITVSTLGNVLSDYIYHKIYLFIMLASGLLASIGLIYLTTPYGVYGLIGGLGVLGGIYSVVNGVTWPRYFGREHLGAITGKAMSYLIICSAIGPSLFSYSFTYFGSYRYIGYLNIIILVVLLMGSFKVKRPG